jgi:hypothetical protein
MLCGSQPPNPLTDNRLREDIVKELDRRARSDTDQHGRRVRPSRSDLWELQVRLLDEAVAALGHRRIHLAPAVLAWHTSRRKMLKPSRRSSYGKDAVTAGPLLRIGSATNSVAHLGKFSGQRYSSAAPFDCGKTPLIPNTRSVGGRFADRVTPCLMPIRNGPSSSLESSYTTSSSCSTTTRQASRYGDRPRPTRQPSNKRMARDFRDRGGRRANSGGSHAGGSASDGVR